MSIAKDAADRTVTVAVTALVLAAASGCGSTVTMSSSTGRHPGAGQTSPGLGAPGSATTTGGEGLPAGSAATGRSGSLAPSGSLTSNGNSSAASGSAASGSQPGDGVATSRAPIKIGLMYSTDANAALGAMGAKTTVPDTRVLAAPVIKYVNAHGGVGGHPVVPAWYNVNVYDSPQAISQGACTAWTQDDHVLAAIPAASVEDNDVMRRCLGSAHVVAVYPNFYSETTQSEFAQSPLWFEPESLSLESWAQVYVAGLKAQDFFHGTKIGVVYDDGPAFTATVQHVLLPELKAAGGNVVATATESIHGANDLGSASSQMSNAVLSFRTKGVTNVMFFEVWQGWAFFAQSANSQHWNPIYGLSSQEALQIMIESGLVPSGQLNRARAVSWNPDVDVPPQKAGSWPRKQLCLQIYSQSGNPVSPADGTEGYHGALSLCEALLMFADAGHRLSGTITSQQVADALQGLTSLSLANLPAARFNGERHFGAAASRPALYNSACTCFIYNGRNTNF